MSRESELQNAIQPLLDWLGRHMNAHRFLWLLALACFLIAWNRGLALLYGLLALLLAVLALSWLLPWWAVRGVRVARSQRSRAQAGGMLSLQYRVRTRSPRYHLILSEQLPCNTVQPEARHFLAAVRPPETGFTAELPCDTRGEFRIEDIGIGSGWPFGFVNMFRRCAAPPCDLLVLPRTFPIRNLALPSSGVSLTETRHSFARPDTQKEFASVREYRFGDSLKRIHWHASARHQTLIVREYQAHDRPELLVVLDAHRDSDVGEAPRSTFEYAVSIAASLIEYAIEQHLHLQLLALGRSTCSLSVAPGDRSSESYLEALAHLKADGDTPYAKAIRRAQSQYRRAATVVTFRNQSDTQPLPAIQGGHLDIVLQDHGFASRLRQGPGRWQDGHGPVRTLLVSADSDLEALFKC